MTPPAPAAVRCALTKDGDVVTPGELLASVADKRPESQVLRDHIRAIAAEMGAVGDRAEDSNEHEAAQYLRAFADKLEGKQ